MSEMEMNENPATLTVFREKRNRLVGAFIGKGDHGIIPTGMGSGKPRTRIRERKKFGPADAASAQIKHEQNQRREAECPAP